MLRLLRIGDVNTHPASLLPHQFQLQQLDQFNLFVAAVKGHGVAHNKLRPGPFSLDLEQWVICLPCIMELGPVFQAP